MIKSPEVIGVYGLNGILLRRFIRTLHKRVLAGGSKAVLDCSAVRGIYPHGAILLHAELDRVTATSSLAKPVKIIPPRCRRCRQVFKQIGLLGLSGDDIDIVLDREDVIYWKCTQGQDQSGDIPGQLLERVAEKANEMAQSSLILGDIWPGISEAIINTTEHAYSHELPASPPSHPTAKWWLLTSIKDSVFAAAVCDLGVGYKKTTPQTVPEWFVGQLTRILGTGNLDSQAIRLAMEYGRTRTGEDQRGKGSRDALSILTRHGAGELVIISNSGCVRYEFDTDMKEPTVEMLSLQTNINATIVWWRLPLTEVLNESDQCS